MKPEIAICMAYYENAGMLRRQVAEIGAWPKAIRDRVMLIMVDDGSPKAPAVFPKCMPLEAQLYRMRKDIRWNQDACRNLAAARAIDAKAGWLLLTDIDHIIPVGTIAHCLDTRLDAQRVYMFGRLRLSPEPVAYKRHPNSFLMSAKMWQRIGGYDERYAGFYGTDGFFKGRAEKLSLGVIDLPVPLVLVPREVIPDASTTTYLRKTQEDEAGRRRIAAEIARSGSKVPVTGRFEWDRVC